MTVKTWHLSLWTLLLSSCFCWGTPELAATLNHKLDGTNSVVYCPTLCVAWQKLQGIVGGPVQMQNPDSLVDELNKAECPIGVIPEKAYEAMAGYTDQGIVLKIEKALRAKFGNSAPTLPSVISDKRTMLVTYSHLQRSLLFPKKFLRSTKTPLNFKNKSGPARVHFFGMTPRLAIEYGAQVGIVHYENPNKFTLLLRSKIENEFIVLAKMSKPEKLSNGVEYVSEQLAADWKAPTSIREGGITKYYLASVDKGDSLAIPVIDLKLASNFSQLCDHPFTNKGLENTFLNYAHQSINFRLDESGAVFRSTSAAAAPFGESSKPRSFIFDKPFLLSVWKKDAKQPYLAIWIASADVLVPFGDDVGKDPK